MTSNVPDIQYPPLLGAAEDKSAEQQQRFYWATGLQLGALAASALLALLPADLGNRSGPVGALVLVLLALGIQVSGVVGRSEQKWYEARAAAESVKSASWQFAMGGESFRIDDKDARSRFRKMLADVLDGLPDLDIGTSAEDGRTATSGMLTTRTTTQQARRDLYLDARVRDQRNWYTKKAAWNKRRATIYMWVVVAVESIAILVGVLRVSGTTDVDLLGFFAACASGLLGWTQAKKYSTLAKAYAVTSHEISVLEETITDCDTEDKWSQAVHDAEAAFSREHTMWLARRQGPI